MDKRVSRGPNGGSTVKVGVVGTTSWGTTLATLLARQGVDVRLLARTEREAELLSSSRRNERLLPGLKLPPSLKTTASPEEALTGSTLVILAVPSRSFRQNVLAISRALTYPTVVVSATKGLELESGKRMSQILEEELDPSLHLRICALSGPNLAREIIEGKPSSTVVASRDDEAAREVQAILNSSRFRVYTNDDLIGVELAGALKNIVALGAGICDGLGYGDNAKAAFITRGLAEISRLGVAASANPLTFAGLAGIGDLVATSSSKLSRNHTVGRQLAKGKTLEEIRSSMTNVAEGVDTTAAAVLLADMLDVEMPITQATYSVLFDGMSVQEAVAELMGRAPSPEWVGIDV